MQIAMNRMGYIAGATALLIAAGAANATTISSFQQVTNLSGIGISTPYGNPTTTYTITLNANATYVMGGNTYTITDIIGVYLLADNFNDVSQPSLSASGLFGDDSDHRAAGSIFGWRSNPNQGITVGNSHTFTWPSINFAQYTEIGFHVRIAEGGGGVTLNIRGGFVPAPGAAAVLGLGGLLAARRRRN